MTHAPRTPKHEFIAIRRGHYEQRAVNPDLMQIKFHSQQIDRGMLATRGCATREGAGGIAGSPMRNRAVIRDAPGSVDRSWHRSPHVTNLQFVQMKHLCPLAIGPEDPFRQ